MFSLSGLLLQFLGLICGSAIACVVVRRLEVTGGVARFLHLMGRIRCIILGGVKFYESSRPLLALPGKPLDFFFSPFGLFLLPGV